MRGLEIDDRDDIVEELSLHPLMSVPGYIRLFNNSESNTNLFKEMEQIVSKYL